MMTVGDTSHRLAPGDTVVARGLTTIRSERVPVPAQDGLTHLQFRRFASCPICNVHLRSMCRRYDELVAAGIHEVVVFHSSVDAMLPHQGDLPFASVADPTRALYAEFGVQSSARSVLHPRAWTAPLHPYAWAVALRERRIGKQGPPSADNADMLGLPADFLLAPDGAVLAAKYGDHANDQWSVDDLLKLASRTRRE